ncbi:hypothetical protein N8X76_03185 [Flavobacteriaceae bacterium]|nr:hypothetical protein [Flavobacteriaceae bacterium]
MKPVYITLLTLLLFSCKQTSLKEGTTIKESKIIDTVNTSRDVIYNQLQGTWVNTQSPLSTLSFNNNTVVNSYDGVVVKKNIGFSIQDSCAGTNFKDTPIEKDKYIVTASDTPECYYIVMLEKENLILGFWGVEEPLRFKKKTENL